MSCIEVDGVWADDGDGYGCDGIGLDPYIDTGVTFSVFGDFYGGYWDFAPSLCMFDAQCYGAQMQVQSGGSGGVAGSVLSNNQQFQTALGLALSALANVPKCDKLIGQYTGDSQGGIVTASDVLQLLVAGNYRYGNITFGPLVSPTGATLSAQTDPTVVVYPTSYGTTTYQEAYITINTAAGVWVNGTDQSRAVLLFHELGHAMNDIFGSGTSGIADDGSKVANYIKISMKNTSNVQADCFPSNGHR